MVLQDILAISGQPGLFKYVAQGRTGIIVESLLDQKRTTVPASAKVSSLSDIAIFTTEEDKPLREVFQLLFEKEQGAQASVSPKSVPSELTTYLESVLPTFDHERVYPTEIKKLIQWYNLLVKVGLTDFVEKAEEEVKDTKKVVEDTTTKKKVSKPATATSQKVNVSRKAPVKKVQAPRKAQ